MSSTYDDVRDRYIKDIAAATRIPSDQILRLYTLFIEDNLISFEMETEFLHNRYTDEQDGRLV